MGSIDAWVEAEEVYDQEQPKKESETMEAHSGLNEQWSSVMDEVCRAEKVFLV